MAKALLLCVTSQNVITFRMGFIKTLQEQGFQVSVVAFDKDYQREIEQANIDFYYVEDENRGLNPLKLLTLKRKYKKIIQEVEPDIIFTFMLKPNVFGNIAAKSLGANNVYSMVEGAGDVFIYNSLKWKILRFIICRLYKKAFKKTQKVFFLNDDDQTGFLARGLLQKEQCAIINGIGVDLNRFSFKPIKTTRTFLMIARMIETKGVYEYCKAAQIVKQKYPDAIFNYIGAEASIKIADIQEYIDDQSVCYLGTTKDVRPYLEDCTVFVLPSYREGLPMSIMEAEATGRVILTTNSIGCRDTVIDGHNGFLIEVRDYQTLAQKMIWLIENPSKVFEMGINSRKFAEERFDMIKINCQICEVLK